MPSHHDTSVRVYCLPDLGYRGDQASKLESLWHILFEDLTIGTTLSREKNINLQGGGEGKISAAQQNAVASVPATAGFCSWTAEAAGDAGSEEAVLTGYLLAFCRATLVPRAIPAESVGLCR